MSEQSLQGFRVAIIANDLFEQSELLEPKRALESAGAHVKVISKKSGEIQGVQHDRKDQKVNVDLTLDEANADDFDALMLPGGAMNADSLRMEKKAQEFARAIDSSGRPLAVICHAPWLLVSANLVKGRRMTSYYTIQDDLRNAGAVWQDAECVADRNWISSRQPADLPRFNQEMIRIFSEHVERGRRAA
jgi:protease I